MTFTPPEVYRAVKERAGGLCEGILEDGARCCSPGDWRGLSFHESPHRSQVARRYQYKESEVFHLCYKCHSARHGIEEMPF